MAELLFPVRLCDNSLLLFKTSFQVFSFARKKVQEFSRDRKILMPCYQCCFINKTVSQFFEDLTFSQETLAKLSLCSWNKPRFLRNSDKSLLSPKKKHFQINLRQYFVDEQQLEMIMPNKCFTNIPCAFFLFKYSAFLEIFFPRKLHFWQVFRTSVFLNSEFLKTWNKRSHVPIFINQFVSQI